MQHVYFSNEWMPLIVSYIIYIANPYTVTTHDEMDMAFNSDPILGRAVDTMVLGCKQDKW